VPVDSADQLARVYADAETALMGRRVQTTRGLYGNHDKLGLSGGAVTGAVM
jgi:hypothetical protein